MEILPHLFTPYRKRLFFFISLVSIVFLLALEFWILPFFFGQKSAGGYEICVKVVEHLLVAAVTAVVLTTFLLFFTPPDAPEAQNLVVKPPDRGRVIEKARHDTDEWWFSGGLGRYTRASTLPELNQQAIRNNKTTAVNIHILDPRDLKLCEAYADYRRTAWSAKNDPIGWTARRVQSSW